MLFFFPFFIFIVLFSIFHCLFWFCYLSFFICFTRCNVLCNVLMHSFVHSFIHSWMHAFNFKLIFNLNFGMSDRAGGFNWFKKNNFFGWQPSTRGVAVHMTSPATSVEILREFAEESGKRGEIDIGNNLISAGENFGEHVWTEVFFCWTQVNTNFFFLVNTSHTKKIGEHSNWISAAGPPPSQPGGVHQRCRIEGLGQNESLLIYFSLTGKTHGGGGGRKWVKQGETFLLKAGKWGLPPPMGDYGNWYSAKWIRNAYVVTTLGNHLNGMETFCSIRLVPSSSHLEGTPWNRNCPNYVITQVHIFFPLQHWCMFRAIVQTF